MNRHGFFCAIWRKGFLCYPLKTASRLNFCGSIFQAFQFHLYHLCPFLPRILIFKWKKKKADSVLLFSLLQNVCFRKFHAPAATRFVPCVPCYNPSKHLALHVLNVASYVVGDRWQGSEEGIKQGKDCVLRNWLGDLNKSCFYCQV